jgi:protein phosphatase
MYYIEAACHCDQGKVRLNNEDNFYFEGQILPSGNSGLPAPLSARRSLTVPACFGVFDGMGGEQHGEEAAYLSAYTLKERWRSAAADPAIMLSETCQLANARVCDAATAHGGERMGSTAAILYYQDASVWICNIGDSRIYRMRNGRMEQLSVDHTDADFLRGQSIRNKKPPLTQHLGIWPREMRIEPYIAREEIEAGDEYLICSDGLTDMLTPAEIAACLDGQQSAEACVENLVEQALRCGGRDNVTVILCRTTLED